MRTLFYLILLFSTSAIASGYSAPAPSAWYKEQTVCASTEGEACHLVDDVLSDRSLAKIENGTLIPDPVKVASRAAEDAIIAEKEQSAELIVALIKDKLKSKEALTSEELANVLLFLLHETNDVAVTPK